MIAANNQNTNYKDRRSGIYQTYFKRVLDLILAILLLAPSLVLVLIGVLLIKSDSKGPAFFSQTRIGKDCRGFTMYKLRTMKMEAFDQSGRRLEDQERITPAGRIIRKLSIDELPQLLNIIKGEMSFIGPRPLLVRYLPHYTNEEIRRHDVLPGITGLAQVNGRRNLDWDKRFALDVQYVENVSLQMDLRICAKTVLKVFKGSDTAAITSQEFPDLDEYRNYVKFR